MESFPLWALISLHQHYTTQHKTHNLPYILAYKSKHLGQVFVLKVGGGSTYMRVWKFATGRRCGCERVICIDSGWFTGRSTVPESASACQVWYSLSCPDRVTVTVPGRGREARYNALMGHCVSQWSHSLLGQHCALFLSVRPGEITRRLLMLHVRRVYMEIRSQQLIMGDCYLGLATASSSVKWKRSWYDFSLKLGVIESAQIYRPSIISRSCMLEHIMFTNGQDALMNPTGTIIHIYIIYRLYSITYSTKFYQ